MTKVDRKIISVLLELNVFYFCNVNTSGWNRDGFGGVLAACVKRELRAGFVSKYEDDVSSHSDNI